jgi:hypothetical protein
LPAESEKNTTIAPIQHHRSVSIRVRSFHAAAAAAKSSSDHGNESLSTTGR